MALAFAIWANDGLPGRANVRYAGEIGNESFARYGEQFAECQPEAARQAVELYEHGRRRCLQSKPDVLPSVVIIGDSHAEHLFYGIAAGLPDRTVAIYLQNDIPFLDAPRFALLFDVLDQNPDLTTVVYAMHWPRRMTDLDDDAGFESRLFETLRHLKQKGVQVLVAGDLPWFASEAPYCKYETFQGHDRYCTALRADADAARLRYGPILARVTAALMIKIVPLRDFLCIDSSCSMAPAGTMLIRDSNHLTVAGSLLLGGRIAAAIPSPAP
ncbi:MAG: hypothetical protein JNK19_11920 [Tabrizicola sp.]|nr:hypothetical protein [Tabrizicola sp.]